jgi:hypothetical protein
MMWRHPLERRIKSCESLSCCNVAAARGSLLRIWGSLVTGTPAVIREERRRAPVLATGAAIPAGER